jgi:AraC-type DNA-binding domain-containing proteins
MGQRESTKEEYLKRINLIVEYINNHLDENIDLEKLAEMVNFSPFHFHRIMKAFLGEPIGAFITRMRIETAARLLRYTEIPIVDIAYKVGYGMPSSLSKAFKLLYGISPNDYRNNKNYTIMRNIQVNPELELEEKVIRMEPKQLIYIRLIGDYQKNDYCMAWQKLWNYVKICGVYSTEMEHICNGQNKSDILQNLCSVGIEHICIYHDDPNVTETDKLRVDVCLAVPQKMEAKGEIGTKQLIGGKYVVYRYQGTYDNLSMVYDTIYSKYLFEKGFKLASQPGFEKYLNDPDCTTPEKLQTEIYIPITD